MNALDYDNNLTYWNSEGNPKGKTSSFLTIEFGRKVQPIEVGIQFQAGFVAEELTISKLDSNSEDWVQVADFEVDDDHDVQSFSLAHGEKEVSSTTTALKFVFNECTDFYGRVAVYKLQVWGREVETKEVEETATP